MQYTVLPTAAVRCVGLQITDGQPNHTKGTQMNEAKISQSQLDVVEFALRIADFWLDGQEPSEQLKLDRQDVEEAYAVIQQLRFDLNGR